MLGRLIDEHRRLLACMNDQQAAMQAFDTDAMEDAVRRQDLSRLQIARLEEQRQRAVSRLLRPAPGQVITLADIISRYPQRQRELGALRVELRHVAEEITRRGQVLSKLTGSVLGHLNMVVRVIADAVEHTGLYQRDGTARMSRRIGVMEATA